MTDNNNYNNHNNYINMTDHKVLNCDGIEFMKNNVEDNSVDLVLVDPPYANSKDTGMDKLHKSVIKNAGKDTKTEADWIEYIKTLKKPKEEIEQGFGKGWSKDNYIKYGHIQGKKYATKTQFGEWDNNFTNEQLDKFIKYFYKKIRKGGTVIIFYDIWKLSYLKEMMENHKFKQIRFIEWIKTNPQPINSKINYLTNCREIALLGVKGGKPTFNSSYDKGIYEYPMAAGKKRFHPTQKSQPLFEELIKKHSNEGDTVMDTFLGGGTTYMACKETNRKFIGCEISKEYFDKILLL